MVRLENLQVLPNTQPFYVGGLVITGILLALLGFAFRHTLARSSYMSAGAGYWSGVSQANIRGLHCLGRQFWLWRLPVARSSCWLIAVGYLFNSFQIANNIMIGTTRIMVAAFWPVPCLSGSAA